MRDRQNNHNSLSPKNIYMIQLWGFCEEQIRFYTRIAPFTINMIRDQLGPTKVLREN